MFSSSFTTEYLYFSPRSQKWYKTANVKACNPLLRGKEPKVVAEFSDDEIDKYTIHSPWPSSSSSTGSSYAP